MASASSDGLQLWRDAWTSHRIEVPQQGLDPACGALVGRNILYRACRWEQGDYAHPAGKTDLGELTLVLRYRMLYEISAGVVLRGATANPTTAFRLKT